MKKLHDIIDYTNSNVYYISILKQFKTSVNEPGKNNIV